ncbi:hypothetical protein SSX86_009606 [Deinandra increscens subsp. villosa]|uniref:F-box domain-containing protein n=1 Tax=Deinandra increscens subsp. villosa TaxID=3103831 RepID=A0AAP0H182_9ASTR
MPTRSSSSSIDDLGMDLLENILARLPSVDFAYADCVSRSWNHVCSRRVLCRPKLSSACSMSRSLGVAVEDAVNKVLLEPIRPHFAIASVFQFDLDEAHQLINAKLGSKFPLITVGRRDAASSNESKETRVYTWKDCSIKAAFDHSHLWQTGKGGIMLTIGFVPGLKLQSIPLLKQGSGALMIDKFMTDIREFSRGPHSPATILIFTEPKVGMDAVMQKLGINIHMRLSLLRILPCHRKLPLLVITACIVILMEVQGKRNSPAAAAVSLVFVMDTNKPAGIGKTEFHVQLSSGMLPTGPVFAAASIKNRCRLSTTVVARADGPCENLDGGTTAINQAYTALERLYDTTLPSEIYIGITKRRKCSSIGGMTSLAFYDMVCCSPEYLSIQNTDMGVIETSDTFRLFYKDPTTVAANVSNGLRSYKQWSTTRGDKWEVLGGLVFTSSYRGGKSLDQPNVDTSLFFDNFPTATLGSTFYGPVFGRGNVEESQDHKSLCCYMHEYCGAYLILSYAP